jgi:tetratricopeptide (TPR) repeat protein
MNQLSNVLGIFPSYAEQLERCGVYSLADLAKVPNVEKLSVDSGVPGDWLQQWKVFAEQKVAALEYRRKSTLVLAIAGVVLLGFALAWLLWSVSRLRSANVHFELGNSLYGKGEHDQAIAEYEKALAIKPDYAEAHNNFGVVLYDQLQYHGAVVEYQKALSFKPDFAGAHYNLGNALRETQDFGAP